MKGVHVVVVVVVLVEDQRGTDGTSCRASPAPRAGRGLGMGCTTRFRGLPTWRDHSRLTPLKGGQLGQLPPAAFTQSPPLLVGLPDTSHRGPFSSLGPNIWRVSSPLPVFAVPTDDHRPPTTSNPAAHQDSHPLPPVAPGPDPRELPSIHPPVARRPSPSIQPVPAHQRRLRTVQASTKKQKHLCRNPPSVSVSVDHTSPTSTSRTLSARRWGSP